MLGSGANSLAVGDLTQGGVEPFLLRRGASSPCLGFFFQNLVLWCPVSWALRGCPLLRKPFPPREGPHARLGFGGCGFACKRRCGKLSRACPLC